MARTAPRPVSGAGCGACTIIRSAAFTGKVDVREVVPR